MNDEKKAETWLDRLDPKALRSENGGDVIQVKIGNHASQVAAGKNVTLTIQSAVGSPQPDDAEQVRLAIDEFRRKFSRVEDTLNDTQKYVGRDKVEILARELSRKEEEPSGDLIQDAGNWLLDNIPAIAEDLLALFVPSSVGRVLAGAGERTIKWLKELYMKRT